MRGISAIAAAGIAGRKLQTGVFAAGCMLCAFFLLSVFVLHSAMEASFDQAYEKLNAPSMTMTIGEGEVNEEELSAFLSRSSCVREYKISKSYLASNVKLADRTMEFAFLASSKDRVPQEEGSIIANSAVYGTVEGDEAELSINGRSISKTIEAKVTDPVNGAPDTMVPWFWIRDQELRELTKDSQKGSWYAELKTKGLERKGSGGTSRLAEKLAAQYEETFGRPFDGSITSYGDIRHSYLFRYEIFSRFIVFLSVFLLAILLCMSLILSRMAVRADRKKIGILKATGFTSGRIRSGYILQFLAVAAPAGTAGLILSGILLRIWLSGMFSNVDRSIFTIRHLHEYQMLSLLILLFLLYAAVRLSIGPMIKASPAGVLKEENREHSRARKSFLLPVPRFLPLNLALSACRKRKLESAFLLAMTMGIGALFLFSVYTVDGVKRADEHLEDWGIAEGDIYISRKTNTDEKDSGLLNALDRDPAVDFYYAGLSDQVSWRLEGSNLFHTAAGQIFDKEIPAGLNFPFIQGRNPRNLREAAIGMNFAKEHRLRLGDCIFITRYGEETRLEVVGVYPSFQEMGNSIRFVTEDIREFFGNRADGYYTIVLRQGEEAGALSQRLREEFPDFDFFPMKRSTARSVSMLLPPLAAAMGVLAIVYFLILVCMKKIMVLECRKEMETLRRIGFPVRTVQAAVRQRFAVPVILGSAAAVFPAIYGLPRLLSPLAQQLGLVQFPIYPSPLLTGEALLAILICSLASSRAAMGMNES